MNDINTQDIIEIRKGNLEELSHNEIAFPNENSRTEILDKDGNIVVITEDNYKDYLDIFNPNGKPEEPDYEYVRFLPISKYGSKEDKSRVAKNMTHCKYKLVEVHYVDPKEYGIMPLLEASGTYVRVGITGPTLTGNNNMRFTIQYWSSSSSVWNADGQEIRGWRKWEGQAWTSQVLGTLWSGDLGKYLTGNRWSYTYNVGFQSTWMQIEAETADKAGDSRFYATTGAITCYKGTYSCSNIGQYAERNTLRLTFRAYHGEDLVHKNFNSDGSYYWSLKSLPTTGSGTSTYDFDCYFPKNFAGSMSYGLIPSGGTVSSPWQWGSTSIAVKSTFSSMSMPTVSAYRHSDDPTKVTISWTAGGTTNKPLGDAYRTPVLILRGTDEVNVATKYDINLESAGSYTFTGVPVNKGFNAFAEYSVSGLQGGTHYQKSNYVWIEPVPMPKIKVNGDYKNVTNTYIKVGGAYKRAYEIYIKVGGVYKKIIV